MLKGKPNGTFLFRFSSYKGFLAVSYVENDKPQHGKVEVSELGFKFENESKLYMSLQALVNDYHKLLMVPVDNVAFPSIAATGSPPSTPPPTNGSSMTSNGHGNYQRIVQPQRPAAGAAATPYQPVVVMPVAAQRASPQASRTPTPGTPVAAFRQPPMAQRSPVLNKASLSKSGTMPTTDYQIIPVMNPKYGSIPQADQNNGYGAIPSAVGSGDYASVPGGTGNNGLTPVLEYGSIPTMAPPPTAPYGSVPVGEGGGRANSRSANGYGSLPVAETTPQYRAVAPNHTAAAGYGAIPTNL